MYSTEYTVQTYVYAFVWIFVYKTWLNCFIHLCLHAVYKINASSIELSLCCCVFHCLFHFISFVGRVPITADFIWMNRSEELWVWICGLRCFLSSRLLHIYRLYFICTKRIGYFSTFCVKDCPFLSFPICYFIEPWFLFSHIRIYHFFCFFVFYLFALLFCIIAFW